MHIPDGYLGPQTCLATYGVMAPLWVWASRQVRRNLPYRQLPLMALSAAFAFVLMMFNLPVPGGTTGHAVGGVLVAILLGPWAALVALSVTLAVQALLFGDGGLTTLGANCLTMAVLMPFSGYWTYRMVAAGSEPTSRRRWAAAALGGYVGINAAAVGAAMLFGLQPALAHDASGRALYCPFALDVALPAMALPHLLVLGFVEAAVTGLVFAHLARVEPSLMAGPEAPPAIPQARPWKRIAVGLGVLLLLVPLGLYLPSKLGSGGAWGEWGGDQLEEITGFVPGGLHRLERLWHAPLPDYGPPRQSDMGVFGSESWYLISGIAGAALVTALLLAARRVLARREADGPPT
jgi:cobalt/nickel transport system permease protein